MLERSAMITRKTKRRPFTRIWPYTPEPSPPLEATEIQFTLDEDFKMAAESPLRSSSTQPKKESGIFSPSFRPTLDDVLNETAPAPYTLAAYTAFLSQQHCLETLEFVTEAKKYSTKYDEYAASFSGMPLTTDTSEGFELQQDWIRIMDIYVKPGAPREINLPAEERDDLVDEPYDPKPPLPESLDPAVRRMRDLMSDSIFIPFCNSVKAVSLPVTYGSALDFTEDRSVPARRHHSSRRSPPTSSGPQLSTSLPQSRTSTQSRNAQARLSQHLSSNSVPSESALTDDSGSGSPNPGDLDTVMSPPLTPPASDMPHVYTSSNTIPYAPGTKPARSESGGWKRMTRQIFGNKK